MLAGWLLILTAMYEGLDAFCVHLHVCKILQHRLDNWFSMWDLVRRGGLEGVPAKLIIRPLQICNSKEEYKRNHMDHCQIDTEDYTLCSQT